MAERVVGTGSFGVVYQVLQIKQYYNMSSACVVVGAGVKSLWV